MYSASLAYPTSSVPGQSLYDPQWFLDLPVSLFKNVTPADFCTDSNEAGSESTPFASHADFPATGALPQPLTEEGIIAIINGRREKENPGSSVVTSYTSDVSTHSCARYDIPPPLPLSSDLLDEHSWSDPEETMGKSLFKFPHLTTCSSSASLDDSRSTYSDTRSIGLAAAAHAATAAAAKVGTVPVTCPSKASRKHRRADSEKPRRPQNAFILFSNHARQALRATHRTTSNMELSRMLGHQWKLLDKASRQYFEELAEETRREFKIAHPDYKYAGKKRRPRGDEVKSSASTDSASPAPLAPKPPHQAPAEASGTTWILSPSSSVITTVQKERSSTSSSTSDSPHVTASSHLSSADIKTPLIKPDPVLLRPAVSAPTFSTSYEPKSYTDSMLPPLPEDGGAGDVRENLWETTSATSSAGYGIVQIDQSPKQKPSPNRLLSRRFSLDSSLAETPMEWSPSVDVPVHLGASSQQQQQHHLGLQPPTSSYPNMSLSRRASCPNIVLSAPTPGPPPSSAPSTSENLYFQYPGMPPYFFVSSGQQHAPYYAVPQYGMPMTVPMHPQYIMPVRHMPAADLQQSNANPAPPYILSSQFSLPMVNQHQQTANTMSSPSASMASQHQHQTLNNSSSSSTSSGSQQQQQQQKTAKTMRTLSAPLVSQQKQQQTATQMSSSSASAPQHAGNSKSNAGRPSSNSAPVQKPPSLI
mmetsp:Transcript_17231/g.28316  ORF Transcript_17231/g.28316 Transcript_17231/m.28316 type:complete len:702 (-) Transcript_17231:678-2783(-)|eukprot:CAMPEP_0184331356 /NCGR_PEP_ID=MMETSP1089-20130417/697_1 /TAXON_ID=38269 ORGANISM="Gloeochaete wittrockiana, Strain SAG46.84" /NCGR_SAMPLE_ID=MMETSP1089 /ASSEMBLY_ACC=CAM_ASM_000445 /LENGTH=701 /DNA_ID=CAMNT_0026654243 /DNA_START=89 /DNA_END=2194 /DNA_ORIENTATION=+